MYRKGTSNRGEEAVPLCGEGLKPTSALSESESCILAKSFTAGLEATLLAAPTRTRPLCSQTANAVPRWAAHVSTQGTGQSL